MGFMYVYLNHILLIMNLSYLMGKLVKKLGQNLIAARTMRVDFLTR